MEPPLLTPAAEEEGSPSFIAQEEEEILEEELWLLLLFVVGVVLLTCEWWYPPAMRLAPLRLVVGFRQFVLVDKLPPIREVDMGCGSVCCSCCCCCWAVDTDEEIALEAEEFWDEDDVEWDDKCV